MRTCAALAMTVLLVSACGTDNTTQPQDQPAGSGPVRVIGGVPVGYSHDAAGAQEAAVRYVAVLGGRTGLDPSRRDLALAAVSRDGRPAPAIAARWATRPTVELATGATAAVTANAPLVAAAVPVLARVTAYDSDVATVTVWVTAVLGTERLGSLDQSWSTETVTLAWDGDWKLTAYDSTPGPVPALHQPVTALDEALTRTAGMSEVFDATP